MKNKIESIVVPFDKDEVSLSAADYAVALAKKEGARVILLYVIEHPTQGTFNSMGIAGAPSMEGNIYIEMLIEKTEERMAAFTELHDGVDIRWHIKIGHPYEQLTEVIGHEKGDLIIIGTHEPMNGSHSFVQSHTERIINHCLTPVIVVRETTSFLPARNILFATNFRGLNPYFMKRVVAMQKLANAKLTIVKINTPTYFMPSDEDDVQYRNFASQYDLPEHDFVIFNDVVEEEGIIKVATSIKADLIMVGNHARSGLKRILLHNTVESLIRQTETPVWSWRLGLTDD